jgi:hypothetical protein
VTIATTTCTHHWLIESPNGPYSLAKCKKCGKYDAMFNSLTETVWAQGTSPKRASEDTINREVFLQERIKKELVLPVLQEPLKKELIKRSPIQYTDAVKTQVLLDLIRGKTIAEVSRINKVPTSTVHGWRNTYSNYPKVKTSGNTEIFKKIILEKIGTEGNISDIAKEYNMPRRTLRDWAKKKTA